MKDPASAQAEALALVEFEHCVSAKLGAPNDEVFEGHPLDGKGLEPYAAQRVVNSLWVRELEKINSIHTCYDPGRWRDLEPLHFLVPRLDVRVRREIVQSRDLPRDNEELARPHG